VSPRRRYAARPVRQQRCGDSERSRRAALNIAGVMLTVTEQGSGSGVVTSSPAGSTASGLQRPVFARDLRRADGRADAGSIFTGWLGACTGNAACTVQINGAKSVSATFAPGIAAPLSIDIDRNGHTTR